jgi:chromosome segregation ATPase
MEVFRLDFYNEFPTLQAIETQLENDIERIKKEISEVKTHPRYADNEAERKYQLEQLEKEREEILAKAEENYQTELKAIELSIAEQAFTMPDVDAEQLKKAQQLAAVIKTQLLTTTNIDDTLDLLKTRIKTMSDAEKQAVKIELAALNLDIDGAKEVMAALDDTVHMRSIKQQQAALRKIKQGADSLRRKYDLIDLAIKRGRD